MPGEPGCRAVINPLMAQRTVLLLVLRAVVVELQVAIQHLGFDSSNDVLTFGSHWQGGRRLWRRVPVCSRPVPAASQRQQHHSYANNPELSLSRAYHHPFALPTWLP